MAEMKFQFTWRRGLRALMAGAFMILGILTGTRAGEETLSPAESELVRLINDARAEAGLPPIPVSVSLNRVARLHVADLDANRPDMGTDPRGQACNLHSWSGNGDWTPVCYTSDHHYSSLMWNKPREITGVYDDNGYEIAYGGGGSVSAEGAMSSWKSSPDHLDVILERNIWTGCLWQSLGVALEGNYAVAWFGEDPDPAGELPLAGASAGPVVSQDHPDPVAAYGGLSLKLRKETFEPGEDISFVVSKWSAGTADLTNSRFRVEVKTEDGWETFFRSGLISYKKGPFLETGQSKNFSWNGMHRDGVHRVKEGKTYRLKFYAPQTTREVLHARFKIAG